MRPSAVSMSLGENTPAVSYTRWPVTGGGYGGPAVKAVAGERTRTRIAASAATATAPDRTVVRLISRVTLRPAPWDLKSRSSRGSPGSHRRKRLAQAPDELRVLLVAAEARHEVRALDGRSGLGQEGEGELQAHVRAALAGSVHRRPRLVRDRDPWHLVVEELGMAGADQRQDAEPHRHRESARAEP